MTRDEAIARIERSRSVHEAWIAHYESCDDGGPGRCSVCTAQAEVAGDVEHHREVAESYTGVLGVLRTAPA